LRSNRNWNQGVNPRGLPAQVNRTGIWMAPAQHPPQRDQLARERRDPVRRGVPIRKLWAPVRGPETLGFSHWEEHPVPPAQRATAPGSMRKTEPGWEEERKPGAPISATPGARPETAVNRVRNGN